MTYLFINLFQGLSRVHPEPEHVAAGPSFCFGLTRDLTSL